MLIIALCAVWSGGQTAADMAIFADAKREFPGRFLQLRKGAPSHDTFSRLFRQLDRDQYRACFQKFVARFGESCGGVIAIDGKPCVDRPTPIVPARWCTPPRPACRCQPITRPAQKCCCDHGRIEPRTSFASTEIAALQNRHRRLGLTEVGKVVRTRDSAATKATTETAYCLLSKTLSPERLGEVVRCHWGVENRPHWVLNAVMKEDEAINRNDNTAYNLAILRHMALNLMQKDRSRGSLRSKFNLAGWKDEFLAGLLAPT